jgi:4-amino-4-deoxy-L-arabinose transferase-like glycosyltransferase
MIRDPRPAVHWSTLEPFWLGLSTALTTWSLLAVGLAQAGLFRSGPVLMACLVAGVIGWAAWRGTQMLGGDTPRRETVSIALLVLLSLLLFAHPAEHWPLLGDSAVYPNTAALLIRTGGLTYHYDPLDGLSPQQKQLFYVPSDRQLPTMPIRSYQGLLYGAYYVMDPAQNTVVSSRPPLVVTWMGWFGMLLGERAMLYVAPIFGALSLVVVYLLGKRIFTHRAGMLAALWLVLSFPQLHFSRAPYAEVVGQFFVLSAMYCLICYLESGSPWHCGQGIAAMTAAFAARIDAILILPTLGLFLILLAVRRDKRGLATSMIALTGAVAFTLWTLNRPYTGATAELLLAGHLRTLRQLDLSWIGLGLLAMLSVIALAFRARRIFTVRVREFAGLALALGVILGTGYALYIRPRTPEYFVMNGEWLRIYSEEVMAVPARYMSPLFFWLAAFGIALLLWKGRLVEKRAFFLFFIAPFGVVFFWRYTTATVYPVALRRLVPEVFPGLALLAASAVDWLAHRPRGRWVAVALAGLVIVLLLSVSAPYWFQREAVGTGEFMDMLSRQLPDDAVVLFEPLRGDSIAGWFAAPLWSFRGRQTLLLNQGELDAVALRETICFWQDQGKQVYVVAQEDPAHWWQGDFRGHLQNKVIWDTSIIGQSRLFPPFVWRFAFAFYIYRWEEAYCACRNTRASLPFHPG